MPSGAFVALLRQDNAWDETAESGDALIEEALARLGLLAGSPVATVEGELSARFARSAEDRLDNRLAKVLANRVGDQEAAAPDLDELVQLAGLDSTGLAALIEALADADPDAPPTEEEELAPFLPAQAEPDSPEAERYLHQVQQIVHDSEDRDTAEEKLSDLVDLPGDLAAMQVLGAALVAVDVQGDALARLMQRAGGAAELGIAEAPFAKIPQGPGRKGSEANDLHARPDEMPVLREPVSDFRLLATPVTQALHLVLARLPFPQTPDDLRLPATLSWQDAVELLRDWTNRLPGTKVSLPTEIEWETACRATTQTAWWIGDDAGQLPQVALFSAEQVGPVLDDRWPNEFGLFDMHGCIWEWCDDAYRPYAGPPDAEHEGKRVARGGSWAEDAPDVRSARRGAFFPDKDTGFVGLRPLLRADDGTPSPTAPENGGGTPTPTAPNPGGAGQNPPPGGGGGEPEKDKTGGDEETDEAPSPDDLPGDDEPPETQPGRPITGTGRPGEKEDAIVAGGAEPVPEHGDECCCVCCGETRTVQPGGDLPAGQNTPEEEAAIDDVVAGAGAAVAQGNDLQKDDLDEDQQEADELAEDAAQALGERGLDESGEEREGMSAEERRVARQQERIAKEQAEIDKLKKRAEREQERINEDRAAIDEMGERIDELKRDEAEARRNNDTARADALAETRRAIEGQKTRAEASVEHRQQRVDATNQAAAQRSARIEAAKDRGYGLTKAQHKARKADRRLAEGRAAKSRTDEALDLLREKEAAQGGLNARDRALKRRLERRSDRLGREVNGPGLDTNAQDVRNAEAARDASNARQVELGTERAAAAAKLKAIDPATNADAHAAAKKALEGIDAKITANAEQQTADQAAFNAAKDAYEQAHNDYLNNSLAGQRDRARMEAYGGADAADSWAADMGKWGKTRDEALGQQARGRRMDMLRDMPTDELLKLRYAAVDASNAIEGLKEFVGKPGAMPADRNPVAKRQRAQAANAALADIGRRLTDGNARLEDAQGRRRNINAALRDARKQLAALGASEYSPATGSNAAEITELQDQVRDLRPQLGRAQSDIDAARGDLAAAGAQLPQARRAALEGLPGGVHARAFDRVAERNAELAPWVERNGDLKREVVREEAGRMLRAYQRYANHDRRAKALALLGNKNDPQVRAAFDTAERERAKARGELEAGGWNFGDDAKINLPDSPVGKGFAHAFSSNSVSRRERKAKADWDTAYESPDSTVARLSEAAKGQEAIATVMQALGFFSPSVFIGPGRPSTQVAEEKSDEAKEADKRAAAVVRAIDEFVAKHSVPGHRAALKRALLEGLVGLSEATIRKLLQDAASTFGPYDLDPAMIVGRVMDLFQEGARQINGVDGAARAALARVEAMRGLAEGLLAAGGTVTEEVIKNASAGYEDALAKAAAALDAQQAAAMARGQTRRAATIGSWAQSLRTALAAGRKGADANDTKAAASRIGNQLEFEIGIAEAEFEDLKQAAARGDLTGENAKKLNAAKTRLARLFNARIQHLSTIAQAIASRAKTDPFDDWVDTNRSVNSALADAIATEAARLENEETRTDGEANTTAKTAQSAVRLRLYEALHRAQAGDFAAALRLLNTSTEDAELKRLSVALALHVEQMMEAIADSISEVDGDAQDWANIRVGLLAIVEQRGATKEVRGNAAAKSAAIHVKRKDSAKALDALKRALKHMPGNPQFISATISLIVARSTDEPPDPIDQNKLTEIMTMLAQVPASQTSGCDAAALAMLVSSMPEDKLALIDAAVAASTFSDKRKRSWSIRLETLRIYAAIQDGATSAEAQARAAPLLGLIDLSDMDAQSRSAAFKQLTSGLTEELSYTSLRTKLSAGSDNLSVAQLETFAKLALQRGDTELGVDAIIRIATFTGEGAPGATAGLFLLQDMASRVAAIKADDPASDAYKLKSRLLRKLRGAANAIYFKERAIAVDDLAMASERRADHLSEEAEKYWFERAGRWAWDHLDEGRERALKQREAQTKALHAKEIAARDRIRRLTDQHARLEILTGSMDPRTIDRELRSAEDLVDAAENLLEARRGGGSISAAERRAYFRSLAQLRAAQALEDAWRSKSLARLAQPDPKAGETATPPEKVDKAALHEVMAMTDELYGKTAGGGLYGQLIALQTAKDQTESTRRQIAELSARIDDIEARQLSWIFNGPLLNPVTGRLAGNQYRTAVYADTLRLHTRLAEIASFMPAKKTVRDAWRQMSKQQRAAFRRSPQLGAYAAMRGKFGTAEGGQPDPRDFMQAMILSLNATIAEGHRELHGYYFPESRWDYSVVQCYDAWIADFMAETLGYSLNRRHSDSYKSAAWRLQELEREANLISDALLDWLDPETELSPESRGYQKLQLLGLLVEVEENGQTKVVAAIPKQLKLSHMYARLNIPENSVWTDLTSFRTISEITATVAISGLLGVGIAAVGVRMAMLATRLGIGARGIALIAESSMAMRSLGVLREAAAMTAGGRMTRALMAGVAGPRPGGAPPQLSLLEEFGQNLATFALLDVLGPLIRLQKGNPQLEQARQRLTQALQNARGAPVLGSATVAATAQGVHWGRTIWQFLASGVAGTGIESMIAGNPVTLDAFVRNLIQIPGMQRLIQFAGNHLIYPRPRFNPQAFRAEAPLRAAPEINKARLANARQRFEPAMRRLRDLGPLDDLAAQRFDNIERVLGEIGIKIRLRDGDGTASFSKHSSGTEEVQIYQNTPVHKVLEELAKGQAVQALRLSSQRAFTLEHEALIERTGMRILSRQMYGEDGPATRLTRRLRDDAKAAEANWARRLRDIRNGRLPNIILRDPGLGLIVFGKPDATTHPLQDKALAELHKAASDTVRAELDARIADVTGGEVSSFDQYPAWRETQVGEYIKLSQELTRLRALKRPSRKKIAEIESQIAGVLHGLVRVVDELAPFIIDASTERKWHVRTLDLLKFDKMRTQFPGNDALIGRLENLKSGAHLESRQAKIALLEWANTNGLIRDGTVKFSNLSTANPGGDQAALIQMMATNRGLKTLLRQSIYRAMVLPMADLQSAGIDVSLASLVEQARNNRVLGDFHTHLFGAFDQAYAVTNIDSGLFSKFRKLIADPTAQPSDDLGKPNERANRILGMLKDDKFRRTLRTISATNLEDLRALDGDVTIARNKDGSWSRNLKDAADKLIIHLESYERAKARAEDTGVRIGELQARMALSFAFREFINSVGSGFPPDQLVVGKTSGTDTQVPLTSTHQRFFDSYAAMKALLQKAGVKTGSEAQKLLGVNARYGYLEVRVATKNHENSVKFDTAFGSLKDRYPGRFITFSTSKTSANNNLSPARETRALAQKAQAHVSANDSTKTSVVGLIHDAELALQSGTRPPEMLFQLDLSRFSNSNDRTGANRTGGLTIDAARAKINELRNSFAGLQPPLPTVEDFLRDGGFGIAAPRYDVLGLLETLRVASTNPDTLTRMVGIDISGGEDAVGPELLLAPYAFRSFLNAQRLNEAIAKVQANAPQDLAALRAETAKRLSRNGAMSLTDAEALFDRLADPATNARLGTEWDVLLNTYREALIKADAAYIQSGSGKDGANRYGVLLETFLAPDAPQAPKALGDLDLTGLAQLNRSVMDAIRLIGPARLGLSGADYPKQIGATIHAGEQLMSSLDAMGLLMQVETAVRMGTDRIGHGVILGMSGAQLRERNLLKTDADIAPFEKARDALLETLRKRGIAVELNISSNLDISNIRAEDHPATKLAESGIRVTINTDDPSLLKTDVARETLLFGSMDGVDIKTIVTAMLDGYDTRLGAHLLDNRQFLADRWNQVLQGDWAVESVKSQVIEHLAVHFLGNAPDQGQPGWQGQALNDVMRKIFGAPPQ